MEEQQPQASATAVRSEEGSPLPPPPLEDPAGAGEALVKRKGKVKWFNSSKGYGFITPEEGGSTEDVFVHQTAIHAQGFRSLQQGEEVEYVAEESEDGRWRAVEVKGPDGAYVQGAARRYAASRGSRGRGARPTAPAAAITLAPIAPALPHYQRFFAGVCYSCGLVGHMARECPAPFYPIPARPRAYPAPSCYLCGAIGHLLRNCPNAAPSS